MAMLDMEKRTGIKKNDIDDWVKKTDALSAAIAGIADGSLDPDTVSLKKYGILNEKEKEEERIRKEKNKKELDERVRKEKAIEAFDEKRKWWDGAEYMYGPRLGSREYTEEEKEKQRLDKIAREKRTIAEKEKMINKYSMNYDRWNDKNYVPDDKVSIEEREALEKIEEDKKAKQFEETNNEWCGAMKEDMEKRNKTRETRSKEANANRLKGNRYFGKKDYKSALKLYKEALQGEPYKANILTNIALCLCKLSRWIEAMEYCDRANHLEKKNVKCLSRKAVIYLNSDGIKTEEEMEDIAYAAEDARSNGKSEVVLLELGYGPITSDSNLGWGTQNERRKKALKELYFALECEPENKDIIKQKEEIE